MLAFLTTITASRAVWAQCTKDTDCKGDRVCSSQGVCVVEGGMPAMEAIKAATSVPAKFLDLDSTGSIAVGKLGELVGVPGDPLSDIGVMERVVFVMKDDTVYKAP